MVARAVGGRRGRRELKLKNAATAKNKPGEQRMGVSFWESTAFEIAVHTHGYCRKRSRFVLLYM